MDFDKVIKTRKSVRAFKPKEPDWRDIIEAIDSVRYAPMAGNNFTPKIILVDDKNKIREISKAAQQDFFADVSHLIVVCSDPKRTINLYEEKGEIYSRQQAGAAIENLILSLHNKGLATCWVGHFVEEEIKQALSIPPEIIVEAVLPVGYESKVNASKKRVDIDMDRILYFNKYKNKKMRSPREVTENL